MKPAIGIVALGAANRGSIHLAIERACGGASFVDSPDALEAVDAIVIPGVAHFGYAVAALDNAGLRGPLLRAASRNTPMLGICVGLQVLFEGSTEAPGAEGLALFRGVVKPLGGPKNPHIGWNRIEPLAAGEAAEGWAYFAHGFAAPATAPDAVAQTTYGAPFASIATAGSVLGVQFHPERSGDYGARILAEFVERARRYRAG